MASIISLPGERGRAAAPDAEPDALHTAAMPLTRCFAELVAAESDTADALAARAETVPTPEALAVLGESLGIAIGHGLRLAGSLKEDEFPAVVLLRSGAGLLVVGRSSDGGVLARKGESIVAIPPASVTAAETGTIFFPRPAEAAGSNASVVAAEARGIGADHSDTPTAAPPRGRDLARDVLAHLTGRHRGLVLQLLLAAALGNLMLLALPLFSMAVYDRVIPHAAKETLWALAIGMTVALIVDLAVRYVRLKLQDALSIAAGTWIQARAYRHLLQIGLGQAPRNGGHLASQLRDVDAICLAVPGILTGLLVDVPFLLIVFAVLVSIGGSVALVPIAGLAILAAIHVIAGRLGDPAAIAHAGIVRDGSSQVIETVAELESIRAGGAEARLLDRFERAADRAAGAGHVARLWAGFAAHASLTVGQLMIVLVVVVAVHAIGEGAMTVGSLSAATLLVGRVIGPVGQLVGVWSRLGQIRRSLTGFDRFLSAPREAGSAPGEAEPVPPAGPIAFRNVSFGYGADPADRLQSISLLVEPGERVGIIGRSGSGKSTLLKLMVRLTEPRAGAITYAGSDMRQFAPEDLRREIGYLRQEPTLLDDSLVANIVFRPGPLDRERLERALDVSGARDLVARSPEGLSTRVGPRGERLSGGERQAVALARLLYADPSILVLDEPTAAMDTMMEAKVVQGLTGVLAGRTLVLATHRAPLLALVDRLVWIEGGRIVADGPKAAVLERMGRKAA